MSTFYNALDTEQGRVYVLTKTRWLFFLKIPRTSVTPHNLADLKDFGTCIKWTTDDPNKLAVLHNEIISTVQRFGIAGLANIAISARAAHGIAKAIGGKDVGLYEIGCEAAKAGSPFPISLGVLKYVKNFM